MSADAYSAGQGNILQTVLLSFFSVFILSIPSKVVIIVIEFMFLGIFWALLRAHFNPRLTAQAKMSLSRGPKHIYAHEHKLYCFIICSYTYTLQWRETEAESHE